MAVTHQCVPEYKFYVNTNCVNITIYYIQQSKSNYFPFICIKQTHSHIHTQIKKNKRKMITHSTNNRQTNGESNVTKYTIPHKTPSAPQKPTHSNMK